MKLHFTPKMLLSLLLSLFATVAMAQSVSGKVTDNRGDGLPGVTIQVKGTSNGTVSDADGSYTIQAKNGDMLVLSFVGMETAEVTVTGGGTLDIVMEDDATTLSDVIVTTTRQPIRKIQATTAVDVISPKLLQTIRPEGFSEAIQGTPGVYTSQSQGRFRGAVFIRGFPDGSGNGLVYTGILIDGLPSLATPARPPDFAFGMDANVQRIEVVRGGAATLFGRASAAGVVNVISKVGGTTHKGSVGITNYSENVSSRDGFDMKLEANFNGPISDKFRYNVGGFYVNDRGFRDLGYDDRGGQLRFNIDYLGGKTNARVFGGYTNMTIQNMIDIPYRLSDNKPREGWEITDSYYADIYDNYTHPFLNGALGIPDGNIQVTRRDGTTQNRSLQAANEDGNYANGFNAGLFLDFELAENLTLSNKFRYQSYDHGTKFNLGVSSFYFGDPNDPTNPINLRILIDGDGNDTDIIDELRLTYNLEGDNASHSLSLGTYYSRGNYTPETYSWFHVANADADTRQLGFFAPLLGPDGMPIMTPGGPINVPTLVGGNPVPFGSAARRDEYTINVNSVFFGDEMKFGDDLIINAGVRWDQVSMDLAGFYNDPNDPDSPGDITREEQHSDFSFSLGANYLLNERSAVYGNFVRAFRMPDYGAYSPVDPASFDPNDPEGGGDNPRITDNETVYNAEVGYRTGFGDLGIDAGLFYTQIQNRLATVYEGAIAVTRPLGTNQIAGGELGLTFAPSGVKGLLIRSSFTYQNATFQDFIIPVADADPEGNLFGLTVREEAKDADGNSIFAIDLKGNQIPRVPSTIFNVMANYDSKYFGANAMFNIFANRYADATNLAKQDDMTNLNVGVYLRYPFDNGSSLRLNLLVKNVINQEEALRFLYVADNDAVLARQQLIESNPDVTEENTFYTGIPFLPRRTLLSLIYDF